ncbi:Redoxin-domain-containing protein [Gloeophyllum trabeum ATCC 11539]|uniref:Redoxin-domain-containing protein n=1 Tax=Gloeophyllum trabeum (strain ATCC 11539 / FP-39264 / Madison 617) TaxID=670483 RepID=S7Q119_GLOTA|nr:Redoxin-domain-containing protein [Gloeophyllum trabeum ATCC 11539]EPQ53212.1 Redoxin-domain-containing protein [Gloeophyllum trabeum ATCC 11539]
MTSVITGAAQALHSAAAAALSKAQVKPGDVVPAEKVKEAGNAAPDAAFPLKLEGKNVIVGVPGAFTGTCTNQVPGYIQKYDQFQAKGVNEIYIVAVNDAFVLKAWKDQLAPSGTPVKFIADDQGILTSKLGLLFDASPLLGAPRSKRYVIITEGDKVVTVTVEPDPSVVTTTAADAILAQL